MRWCFLHIKLRSGWSGPSPSYLAVHTHYRYCQCYQLVTDKNSRHFLLWLAKVMSWYRPNVNTSEISLGMIPVNQKLFPSMTWTHLLSEMWQKSQVFTFQHYWGCRNFAWGSLGEWRDQPQVYIQTWPTVTVLNRCTWTCLKTGSSCVCGRLFQKHSHGKRIWMELQLCLDLVGLYLFYAFENFFYTLYNFIFLFVLLLA